MVLRECRPSDRPIEAIPPSSWKTPLADRDPQDTSAFVVLAPPCPGHPSGDAKPQVWPSSTARDATAWQRHVERRATMKLGRNCGFGDHGHGSPADLAGPSADPWSGIRGCMSGKKLERGRKRDARDLRTPHDLPRWLEVVMTGQSSALLTHLDSAVPRSTAGHPWSALRPTSPPGVGADFPGGQPADRRTPRRFRPGHCRRGE